MPSRLQRGELLIDDPFPAETVDPQNLFHDDLPDPGEGGAREGGFEGLPCVRTNGHDEAALGLREQELVVSSDPFRRDGPKIYRETEAPGEGRFRKRHPQPPVRAVVAGGDEARLDRPAERLIKSLRRFHAHLRNAVSDRAVKGVPLRAAEFPIGPSQRVDKVPRPLGVHRDGLPDVLHLRQRGEEQRGGDRDPGLPDLVVVLHAVLPRDAGDAVGGRDGIEGFVRPDELG